MADPVFLDFDIVEILHAESLNAYGGSPGIRDRGLVESALGAALNVYHYANGDLFDIAAAYAYHLAQAQAYLDGNKRTGVGAALLFLRANGVGRLPDDVLIYDAMIAIAERRLDKPGLAQLFRSAALSPS